MISTTQEAMLSSTQSLRVDQLEFIGNTVLKDADLLSAKLPGSEQTVSNLLGRELTLDDLEQIRVAVTLKYVDAGYINSGAVIPDQPIPSDGEVLIEIVEGKLTTIDIDGRKVMREGYLLSRLNHAAGPPLNVYKLRDQLEILRQDPKLKRINAELRPGALPGEAALNVMIEETFPGTLSLLFSNRRPPSVGAERFELFGTWNNITGYGDSIALRYGINKGDLEDWEWAGLDDFTLTYSAPISPSDTTLTLEFERSDTTIVEAPFDELDLDTESTRFALTLRQPLYRSANTEFAVFATASVQQTTNRLDGEKIDLAPGSIEGESNIAALRLGAEYVTRSTKQALSLRSTLSIGFDAFDATINGGDIPDGRFISWLGQVQYARRLGETNNQLVARFAAQLSPDSLLGPEQFAIGGMDTVRGYRENEVVRDMGVVGSLELRVPVITAKSDTRSILEFAPFVDAGYAFNRTQEPVGEYLISVGAGFLFTPNDRFNATIYYGRHLNDVSDDDGDDLQDYGIHFAVSLRII